MKTAVQIGAGNIGRGFMAQIFRESGYRVIFIDVNRDLIEELNRRKAYEIELVSNEGSKKILIDQVSGVSGLDLPAATEKMIKADLMATAVGVAALPKIVPLLVEGLRRRWAEGNFQPLNIFVCENLFEAPKYLRNLILERLQAPEEQRLFHQTVGLVETSIGRMVPGAGELAGADPLGVRVEPYCRLPADRDGFVGEVPGLKYLEPFSPFVFYIQRKLYIHNGGHAGLAYLANLLGLTYIWEAVAVPELVTICRHTLDLTAQALVAEHGVEPGKIQEHIDDLLERFANRALGDTVERVGKDPRRKLGPEDRIIGAYRLLRKHGLSTGNIPLVIAAALRFSPSGDTGAAEVRQMLQEKGLRKTLCEVCGLNPSEVADLAPEVEACYERLGFDPKQVYRGFA